LERTEQWSKDKLKLSEVQKELELRQLAQKAADEKERLESPVCKAKMFGEALCGTMARMPSDAIEILPWFRNVVRLFVDFKVSDDLKVHLLKPHLTEHARNMISRMDAD
jgi:hypothetical protein